MAFQKSRDAVIQHGTLLLNVNLGRLATLLSPDKAKLQSKGVASVTARVANISQLVPPGMRAPDHERVCLALRRAFDAIYEHPRPTPCNTLGLKDIAALPDMKRYYAQLRDWDWVYGRSPRFQHVLSRRFAWGSVEVHFDCVNGRIAAGDGVATTGAKATGRAACTGARRRERDGSARGHAGWAGKCTQAPVHHPAHKAHPPAVIHERNTIPSRALRLFQRYSVCLTLVLVQAPRQLALPYTRTPCSLL